MKCISVYRNSCAFADNARRQPNVIEKDCFLGHQFVVFYSIYKDIIASKLHNLHVAPLQNVLLSERPDSADCRISAYGLHPVNRSGTI